MNIFSFIIVLLLLFFLYLCSVYCIQKKYVCTTKEAAEKVREFVNDSLSTRSVIRYPVWIGIDEQLNPHGEVIEKTFAALSNAFDTFFFYDFFCKDNFLIYRFKCGNPKHEMAQSEFLLYTDRICESIIHKHIRKTWQNFTHTDNIVCTNLIDDVLWVVIAANSDGISGISKTSNNIRVQCKKKENAVSIKNSVIKEEVDNDEMGL